ncbi:MAG: carbon-nitrogen hydrolase family protein [Pseudomonadota bacterium]
MDQQTDVPPTPAERRHSPSEVVIRSAEIDDIAAIAALADPTAPGLTPGQIRGQINSYAEGQLVAVFEGHVVGYAPSFILPEALALAGQPWAAITGDGHAARHDPQGDWLYAMEMLIAPATSRLRLSQRLEAARRRLCRSLGLKGIALAVPLTGYARRHKQYPDPAAYLAAVVNQALRDPMATPLLRAGFEAQHLLRAYRPEDRESAGHAALLLWRNPQDEPAARRRLPAQRMPATARVTTVQMQMREVESPHDFYRAIETFVDAAADYGSDFIVFPELFTLTMLTSEKRKLPPDEAIDWLSAITDDFVETLRRCATHYKINIIGGSHPTRDASGKVRNIAYVALRDGRVHTQEKLHPTPDERSCWAVEGGNTIDAIETDCGPIGVMICYDSEFPELARRLVDQGARMLFVPYCTDTRHGHLRVTLCCQARAIENQAYVVTSGNVGILPDVENMDLQYAQSAIFTPCDMPFARDGIAAETSENVEMVAMADLDLSTLTWARAQGAVRNLRDRRFDLYRTTWTEAE